MITKVIFTLSSISRGLESVKDTSMSENSELNVSKYIHFWGDISYN